MGAHVSLRGVGGCSGAVEGGVVAVGAAGPLHAGLGHGVRPVAAPGTHGLRAPGWLTRRPALARRADRPMQRHERRHQVRHLVGDRMEELIARTHMTHIVCRTRSMISGVVWSSVFVQSPSERPLGRRLRSRHRVPTLASTRRATVSKELLPCVRFEEGEEGDRPPRSINRLLRRPPGVCSTQGGGGGIRAGQGGAPASIVPSRRGGPPRRRRRCLWR